MRRGVLLLLLALPACATPLELGERRYREGDRRAALAVWRAIPESSRHFEVAAERIDAVEQEFEQLARRYRKRGRYYEERERLAESILNYRLAHELEQQDDATLDHVQQLARHLVERKQETWAAFNERFAAGELAAAREHLDRLRALDPFDPELETDQRQLDDALESQVERYLAEGRRGFSTGRLTRAEQSFRAVLDLDPGNETARGHLSYIASMRHTQGQGAPPEASLPPATSDADIDAEGFYQNALAADRSGDPYSAITYDLRALDHRPSHAEAQRHLRVLRQRLEPRVPDLLESGRLAFAEEDLQTAVDSWQRALLIDPDNTRARDYLARAERLLEGLEQLRAGGSSGVATP